MIGGFSDLSHLGEGIVEEGGDLGAPRLRSGGRTRRFERCSDPRVEDLHRRFRRGFRAGEREDVAVADRSSVHGVFDGETRGGVDSRELVGEHRDSDAGPAAYQAADFGGGRGGDAAADFGSGGVV